MKNKALLLSISIGMMSLLTIPTNKQIQEVSAAPGTKGITITSATLKTYKDSYNRLSFVVYNKEGITIENVNLRDSNTSLTPTVCFNGVDYTFGNVTQGTATLNGYVSMLCQEIPNPANNSWPMFFRHDSGQGASGNASWYPTNYPGLPLGQETTIKFYANSVFGQYKILNDFVIRVDSTGSRLDFIYNPHKVTAPNCILENTYNYNGDICASYEGEVTFTPTKVVGKEIVSISISDSESNPISYEETSTPGTYSFKMPDKDVNIQVEYDSVSYKLTAGDTIIKAYPGEPIGTLPEGRWAIDGFPISSKTIYVWNQDKTAVRTDETNVKTYTCKCYVDGNLYQEISFKDTDTKINLPAIPYKQGYEIVGWDLKGIEYKNLVTNAIYKEII